MIRSMTIFSLTALFLTVLSIPVLVLQPGAFILGGHHHIGSGENLDEDVSFYFAQVTIDEGALVDGKVFLYSSTLDLRGDITENLYAFESDVTLRKTANVGDIDQNNFINWTLLLPAIVQIP